METNIRFRETTKNAKEFFALLPYDWQESIVPEWKKYKKSALIYTLHNNLELLAGGIIFYNAAPDMEYNHATAKYWFSKDYFYIGFLWVVEKYRGHQLGSVWLHELFKTMPQQNFWLSIEDPKLQTFYKKNGFRLIKKLKTEEGDEWIMVREAKTA